MARFSARPAYPQCRPDARPRRARARFAPAAHYLSVFGAAFPSVAGAAADGLKDGIDHWSRPCAPQEHRPARQIARRSCEQIAVRNKRARYDYDYPLGHTRIHNVSHIERAASPPTPRQSCEQTTSTIEQRT